MKEPWQNLISAVLVSRTQWQQLVSSLRKLKCSAGPNLHHHCTVIEQLKYYKWDININPQLIINPCLPVTAWQHSPLLLCPQTKPVADKWTRLLTDRTSLLGVNCIDTPGSQQALFPNEANMAAPAETPGTQQNQLKNSILQLKVVLGEWWHGGADKRLSVQTLCYNTHPPQCCCPAGGTPLRPGYLQHHRQQQAICGRLYRVINKCAVWCRMTRFISCLCFPSGRLLAGREEAAGGNEDESVKHSLCICRFSFRLFFIWQTITKVHVYCTKKPSEAVTELDTFISATTNQ